VAGLVISDRETFARGLRLKARLVSVGYEILLQINSKLSTTHFIIIATKHLIHAASLNNLQDGAQNPLRV